MSTSEHEDDLLLGLHLDDRGGPARRISREQAAGMVDQALTTWVIEQAVPPQPARVFPMVAVAAIVLLVMAGGASAARWYFGTRVHEPAVTAPKAAAPAVPERVTTQLRSLTVEAEREPESDGASKTRAPRATHEKAEPEDLLQRANQLRAAGRFQSAADTYAQVYERYPRSLSAYAAQIAAASIELEHLGKPQHARKLFESALAGQPRGALDLEARQGLALSMRDLGRDRDEADVLRALIRAHGETPAARRAEARLKELTGDLP